MDFTETLATLAGWFERPVRVTVHAGAQPISGLNGVLGRAPDAGDAEGNEVRFFCIGHNDPRDGADGFFLPEAAFTGAAFTVPYVGRDPESVLGIGLGALTLVVEVDPELGIPSI